jgi:hypothetical protein
VELETTSRRVEARYKVICEQLGMTINEGSPADRLLYGLVAEYEQARDSVIAKSANIRADLDHLDKIITLDMPSLNNLGELQQRPAALESAVGRFCACQDLLSAFIRTHKRPS